MGELPRGRSVWSVTGYLEVQGRPPLGSRARARLARPRARTTDDDRERRRARARWCAEDAARRGLRRVLPAPAGPACATSSSSRHAHPGRHTAHSAEEEIFVVLDGEGNARALPRGLYTRATRSRHTPSGARQRRRAPAGHGRLRTHSAPASRADDPRVGTREPNDICWYPRSRKMFWRGTGIAGRIEPVDYWDGEELE